MTIAKRVVLLLMLSALAVPLSIGGARFGRPALAAPADPVSRAFAFGRQQLLATTRRIADTRYPDYTYMDGVWITTEAKGWTSGFFPGSLWLAYEQTGDPDLLGAAKRWTANLEEQQWNTSTHDVGFMIFSSYGNGYRLTGDNKYRQVVLNAAASLASRYSPTVGSIRSWNSGPNEFKVIIDNMMNLELLFWAAKNGGKQEWYDMAVSHALKTRANHIRADGTHYQIVIYDPKTGTVKGRDTHQGYNVESTWSRGQAWAIYGFTVAYRETNDVRFLDTARAAADFYIANLPDDQVPYWDFEAPGIPDEPRDSSAAATAAAGLLELSGLDPDANRRGRYREAGELAVEALVSPAYLAEGSGNQAILLHGTPNWNRDRFDTGTIYGDYYLLQAMLRYRELNPAPTATPTSTRTPTATGTRTATATATSTATRTPTRTATATATSTRTATATQTATATLTRTATATTTQTVTATATHTRTATATPTAPASATSTATSSATATPTPSRTPTATASVTSTATSSVTATLTPTTTRTPTPGGAPDRWPIFLPLLSTSP